MTKFEERAIWIVELQEELKKAKSVICEFVHPSDGDESQHRRFIKKACLVAGITPPVYSDSCEQPTEGNKNGME